MAKVKNKRNAALADKVRNKKKQEINKKKINPFEVHVNREKIKVLGKKSKHDKGLPGVSRAKAIQKRKETLGVEMKLINKTNTFLDKRIGEKNNQLSSEDRMVARFAAERARQHTKKNIFNLADDEILTHRGQTLEQIEKFDDPRSDEEDEEGKGFGGLDDDFVSEGHFGGGVLSKTDSKDGAKSHKDLIEQLIAESKKRKAEKQKEKEQTLDLTEKLDSEWKDLKPVVFKRPRLEEKESAIDKLLNKAEKNNLDYDKMMRELKFEKRGTPSDGLKSDEKQAQKEREELERWEKERDQRMLGDDEITISKPQPAAKHRSAEDLDDNFELDNEQDFMLAYDKDGNPLVPDKILKDFSVPNAKPKFEDGISDTSSDEEEEDGESSEDESEEEQVDKDNKNKKASNEKEETILFQNSQSDEGSDAEVGEDDDSKRSQNIVERNKNNKLQKEKEKSISSHNPQSDKSSEDESSDDEESDEEIKENTKSNHKTIAKDAENLKANGKALISDDVENDSDEESEEDDASDKDEQKHDFNNLNDLRESDVESDEMDVAEDTEKITSFFNIKSTEGDNLNEMLTGKTPAQQATALQKLIKSYDPGLAENNKELLSRLFAHLLQYINDIFTDLSDEGSIIKSFLIFDRLVPHLFDLVKTNKVSTKKYLVELLKEKRNIYLKHQKQVPDLDTLIFFKLISLLYPTSDFRHPVTTPALIFMSEILTTCKFNDAYSISRGFFLTALILEYTVLSKRLVPSAINFLRGVIYLSANTSVLNPIQVVPPFRLHKDAKLLYLDNDCSKMAVDNKMAAKDLAAKDIDDDFKIRSMTTCILMLKEFFDHFSDLEAQEFLFEPHIKLLSRVDFEMYPQKMASRINGIIKYMKETLEMKTFTPLYPEKKKIKALRLYEPDVQEVFTGSKTAKLSREKAESARLKSKYKKEMKGALREIRRDKAYIASVKIKQKIQSDNMRKEKVKQIYKDASIQQGELNKLKKMK